MNAVMKEGLLLYIVIRCDTVNILVAYSVYIYNECCYEGRIVVVYCDTM